MHADPDDLDLGGRLLGAAMQQQRKRVGLTRREVSELSGIGYDTVFSVEHGRRLPSLSTLLALAKVLQTTPVALLAGAFPWDDVPRPE